MRRSQPKFWGSTSKRRAALQQHGYMMSRYPQFKMRGRDRSVSWTGTLEPVAGKVFTIRIDYPEYGRPRVYLVDPPMADGCPHTWGRGEMCVFWPDDPENEGWETDSWVADTIVPWSATWLYFYDHWRETGQPWAGPEKSHVGTKE